MIGVLDYGSGNVAAITHIYSRLNIACEVVRTCSDLAGKTKIVLPGVGAFDKTMELLDHSGMRKELDRLVLADSVPVLGVCVGMQIMARSSQEGTQDGLGWIDAEIVKLDTANLTAKPLLPHMGWNSIRPTSAHPILNEVDCAKGFYFLHSYCFKCKHEADVLCYTDYGQTFPSAVHHQNIFGFQFHPEKSHLNGINIFKNFAAI